MDKVGGILFQAVGLSCFQHLPLITGEPGCLTGCAMAESGHSCILVCMFHIAAYLA